MAKKKEPFMWKTFDAMLDFLQDVRAEQRGEKYKNFFQEVERLSGVKTNFSEMTQEQYDEWFKKGFELIKDEAVKTNKTIYFEVPDPNGGKPSRWHYEPDGTTPAHDVLRDGDPRGNTVDESTGNVVKGIKLQNAVRAAIFDISNDKTKSKEKDFIQEVTRLTGTVPDFTKMTHEQFNNWVNMGIMMVRQDVIQKQEKVSITITDPYNGEKLKWDIEPEGWNPEHDAVDDGDPEVNIVQNGKVIRAEELKKQIGKHYEHFKKYGAKTVEVSEKMVKAVHKEWVKAMDTGASGFGR